MNYVYEVEERNYEDYASGRVLYNVPGAAPFPVRLGSEIFARCKSVLKQKGHEGPYTVYDPFCGCGYLLTVLGFLHNEDIGCITASDIDEKMLAHAQRNLGLLGLEGLDERICQIEYLAREYGKDSHKEALESALRLKSVITMRKQGLPMECFCANAMDVAEHGSRLEKVDIVVTDLPYGNITHWSYNREDRSPAAAFLDGLHGVLPNHSVVAVISDKKQKLNSPLFQRIEHFNAGKRQVVLLGMNK